MNRLVQMNGQSLVEVALVLPVMLLILGGSYICCRSAFLASAGETAAMTEALRCGRRQPGIEKRMSDSLIAGGNGISIRPDNHDKSSLLPSPFPSMAGRTKGIVEIKKSWEETGGLANLPNMNTIRSAEVSVDCWGKNTVSGKKVNGIIRGIVAMGIVR